MNIDFIFFTYIVMKKLPKKRMLHTIGVVSTAKKLAIKYKVDVEKVMLAALLHDVSKYEDVNKMKKVCSLLFSEDLSNEDLFNNEILHGFYASYWCENKLNIKDETILNAIKYHTVGRKNMSIEEKIVYIADAIEPSRTYSGVEKLRQLAFENLNLAIYTEIVEKEKFLKSIDKKLHKNTLELKKDLVKGDACVKS